MRPYNPPVQKQIGPVWKPIGEAAASTDVLFIERIDGYRIPVTRYATTIFSPLQAMENQTRVQR
jgi:hypothetical protein